MNKNQMAVIVVLVIVCIGVIGYAVNLNSQLMNERLKTTELTARVADLKIQADQADSRVNEQAQANTGLQSSLDAANAELAQIRSEADMLKAVNQELEAKLNTALSLPTNTTTAK